MVCVFVIFEFELHLSFVIRASSFLTTSSI